MKKFFKSFGFAYEGIAHAFITERNFKFHIVAAIIVIISGMLTGLLLFEWIIIFILIGGMLALELMNSAIERAIDLTTSELHPLAKQAKDLAAGAVLIYAMTSAIIGLMLFMPKWLS